MPNCQTLIHMGLGSVLPQSGRTQYFCVGQVLVKKPATGHNCRSFDKVIYTPDLSYVSVPNKARLVWQGAQHLTDY